VSPRAFPVRVYYEDTDAGGIVYYANYLKFAERARTELIRAAGVEHSALRADDGVLFTVRRCEADYIAPAKLDDLLEVESVIVEMRAASLWLDQTVRRGAEVLARLRIRLACVAGDGRPVPWPPRLRHALDTIARDHMGKERV
jgi:acyl-CoA thioester hydrolase